MESDNKSKLFWIGLFVSAGLAVFIFSVIYLTDTSIDTEYRFNVLFKSGMGLKPGSEIKMLGQEIGQVSNVEILDNRNGVIVGLSINDQLGILIPNNSIFRIKTSIFGQTHIQIEPGNNSDYITTDELVQGEIETNTYDLDPVVKDLSAFSRQLSSVLTEKEVNSLQSIINNADSLIDETKNSLKVSQEINSIVRNIEIFSKELNAISSNLDENINSKALKIDSILIEIEDFSDDLKLATEGLNSFASSAVVLDSSMRTLQNLVNEMNDGKGTLGKLLKDDSLYDNLNEVVDNAKDLINDVKDNPTKYVRAYWKGSK